MLSTDDADKEQEELEEDIQVEMEEEEEEEQMEQRKSVDLSKIEDEFNEDTGESQVGSQSEIVNLETRVDDSDTGEDIEEEKKPLIKIPDLSQEEEEEEAQLLDKKVINLLWDHWETVCKENLNEIYKVYNNHNNTTKYILNPPKAYCTQKTPSTTKMLWH